MSLIQQMTPLNLREEKQKFFDKDCQYNPHFKYSDLITLNKRSKYGEPKAGFIQLAKKILEQAFSQHTEKELRELEGPPLSAAEGERMALKFIQKNNLQDKVRIVWIQDHVSKASAYKDEFRLRKNFSFRKNQFLATLYHEIGTHALRRENYVQQPFYNKKDRLNFKDYMITEEGLASLHSLLASNFKLDYYHALTYLAADLAQKQDFVGVFTFINEYLQNKERSWRLTVKFKRGLYDTSQPGGFSKSIVYLEGMVKVWNYLQKSDFDIPGLYFGKIAVEDVEKAKEMNPGFEPKLPNFITSNRQQYIEEISHIADINQLSSLL